MPLLSLSISQLLLAFVSSSILHKLTSNLLFLKWLVSHKLTCLIVPTNVELKKLKYKSKNHANNKKGGIRQKSLPKRAELAASGDQKDELFTIPTADLSFLKLEETNMTVRDLELINYSVDTEWIVDLSLMSMFSFIITELQFNFYPTTTECNFSLLWTLLVIFYCVKILWKLTAAYFRNDKSIGERSICITSGCLFLLIAMILLLVDEKTLELGLEGAYRSFNESATTFVNSHTLSTNQQESRPLTKPISFILVKFSIAIICSLTGVVFTFPGLRFGQLQRGLLDKPETTNFEHFLYSLNYLSSLIVVLLWVKPLSRNFLKNQNLITEDSTFDTLRIYMIIILNFIRFYQLPKYVAMFLLGANNRVTRIRCRGGSTTNKEIQITISSIYNYVNVVTLQYILPILMCFFMTIMFKSMGDHNWLPTSVSPSTINVTSPTSDGQEYYSIIDNNTASKFSINNDEPSLDQVSQIVTTSNGSYDNSSSASNSTVTILLSALSIPNVVSLNDIKGIFSSDVFRGILGFSIWWLHFSWLCCSTAGLIYHTYLLH